MHITPNPVRTELKQLVNDVKRVGGEVRLQMHLANMDLKKAWDELEPKLAEADRLAEKASDEAYEAVRDMLRKLKRIQKQLPKA